MTYENKAFPLTSGTAYNHYGKRGLQDGQVSGGSNPTYGTSKEAVVYVTGADFVNGTFSTQAILPKGAVVTETIFEVKEAFVLGGTTPSIDIGAATSEGTNYVVSVTEAQAEAVDTVATDAPAGTLASTLTADVPLSVALGGTSPTVTDAGKLKVVVKYSKV